MKHCHCRIWPISGAKEPGSCPDELCPYDRTVANAKKQLSGWLGETLKTAVMTPLQERVATLGTCTYCHTKTLEVKHECDEARFAQCSKCLAVFVLPPPPPTGDACE